MTMRTHGAVVYQSASQMDSSPKSAWAVCKLNNVNENGELILSAQIVSGQSPHVQLTNEI